MYRKILIMLAAAGLVVSVAACASTVPGQGAASGQVAQTAAAGTSAAASRSAAVESAAVRRSSSPTASLRLLIEPGSGIGPVYKLITGARHSVDLTMYELADPAAEADLAADAAHGVNVRVLLDQHLEKSANTSAYKYLSVHRVHVRWAPAGTTYHQKTLTVDNATSVIMTLNLVARDYPGTRDFAAIAATLAHDYAGAASYSPPAASTSSARCTATASVYDASRDENNVYLHSNRPDQEATATADGYSHSYKTDGSGYALIYLNGPAPGARITVTVGGATCTATD